MSIAFSEQDLYDQEGFLIESPKRNNKPTPMQETPPNPMSTPHTAHFHCPIQLHNPTLNDCSPTGFGSITSLRHHLISFHGPQVQTTDNRTLFSQEMFEKMPDSVPTFEQRDFLSWYQLNAYFCPEREAPVSPYVINEPYPETIPRQVLEIPIRTTSKDKTNCPVRPKLRTSRDRIRIQDLRSASVAVASRTSSPDTDVQQRVLEEAKDDCIQPDLLSALAQLQEYQYAEQLDAIPEEDDEEQEALVKPSRTVQHHDYFELKPSHSSTTPSEEIVPSLDTKIFYRRLNDMLHGSPNSQHSRTASSCTQVDEEDNHISLIDSIVETEEGEEYQQRLRRGPSFTESEVEEWYGEQPDNGPKSAIQSLSADLKSHRFNEDACLLFLNMERSLDNLRMKYTGSSDLVAEAKWRLASIMKEMCRESAIAD